MRKPCFALNQFYIELKTKSLLTMPGNVLLLHLLFNSRQNSNVDNNLPDLDKIPPNFFNYLCIYLAVGILNAQFYSCLSGPNFAHIFEKIVFLQRAAFTYISLRLWSEKQLNTDFIKNVSNVI